MSFFIMVWAWVLDGFSLLFILWVHWCLDAMVDVFNLAGDCVFRYALEHGDYKECGHLRDRISFGRYGAAPAIQCVSLLAQGEVEELDSYATLIPGMKLTLVIRSFNPYCEQESTNLFEAVEDGNAFKVAPILLKKLIRTVKCWEGMHFDALLVIATIISRNTVQSW